MTDEIDNMSRYLTEESPEYGFVTALDIVISAAEHWIEDGVHVLRSTEFDVTAGDPDFRTAIEVFGQKTEDLWAYLGELDGLTENENETFLVLAPRFREVLQELERREQVRRRKIVSVTLRRRRDHLRDWQPSTRRTSSKPLPV